MGNNDNMAVHTEKSSSTNGVATTPDFTVKAGLAQMLKGGVIMDVVNAEQVKSPLCLCISPSWYDWSLV
jgi:SOR/SNZ family